MEWTGRIWFQCSRIFRGPQQCGFQWQYDGGRSPCGPYLQSSRNSEGQFLCQATAWDRASGCYVQQYQYWWPYRPGVGFRRRIYQWHTWLNNSYLFQPRDLYCSSYRIRSHGLRYSHKECPHLGWSAWNASKSWIQCWQQDWNISTWGEISGQKCRQYYFVVLGLRGWHKQHRAGSDSWVFFSRNLYSKSYCERQQYRRNFDWDQGRPGPRNYLWQEHWQRGLSQGPLQFEDHFVQEGTRNSTGRNEVFQNALWQL